MPVRRKIFRIEEHARPRPADRGAVAGMDDARHREFMTQLQALRELIEPRMQPDRGDAERARAQVAEAEAFKGELALIQAAVGGSRVDMTSLSGGERGAADAARAARELAAIVTTTERATHAILQAAEEIDHAAHALSTALKGGPAQGLADDIQGRIAQIFEACNFQDITGQHVANAVSALAFIEEHVGRIVDRWQRIERFTPALADSGSDGDRRFLNGPRLSGDSGHASQGDVDAIFGCA